LNILVSGNIQAEKTTILNALCAAIPARARMTAEEVFELQLQQPDVVAMQTRQANLEGTSEIPLRCLVNELSECGQVASSSVRSDRRNMSIWTRGKN
jgi:pilus assembly protein CpaF